MYVLPASDTILIGHLLGRIRREEKVSNPTTCLTLPFTPQVESVNLESVTELQSPRKNPVFLDLGVD